VFDAKMPFEDMCREAARLGCKGFDLVPAQDWPVLKKYGLIPTMELPNAGVTIPDGINRKDVQDDLVKSMRPAIDECAAVGVPT
jgi:hydroxypyruvate isomerase